MPSTFQAVPIADVPLAGISIADPDAGGAAVELTLSVVEGALRVRTDVPGGVDAGDVTDNDTATVTVTASIAAINATLADPTGLVYHVDVAPAGDDTLTVTTDDQGNTGTGGALTDIDTASITFNEPPVITSTAPTTATEDTLYTYAATSTDGDGPGATWSLAAADTCGGSIVADHRRVHIHAHRAGPAHELRGRGPGVRRRHAGRVCQPVHDRLDHGGQRPARDHQLGACDGDRGHALHLRR